MSVVYIYYCLPVKDFLLLASILIKGLRWTESSYRYVFYNTIVRSISLPIKIFRRVRRDNQLHIADWLLSGRLGFVTPPPPITSGSGAHPPSCSIATGCSKAQSTLNLTTHVHPIEKSRMPEHLSPCPLYILMVITVMLTAALRETKSLLSSYVWTQNTREMRLIKTLHLLYYSLSSMKN